jgi:hypothetical protein
VFAAPIRRSIRKRPAIFAIKPSTEHNVRLTPGG